MAKPTGRPSKFNKDVQRQIELLARRGWTDAEMAELLGINEGTLNNWKNKHPAFFKTLKEAKEFSDLEVERSLYREAKAGNTTAMIFWLKNRQPQRWRDKQEHEHSGNLNAQITIKFVSPDDRDNG